jgi:hypothetical protein
MIKSPLANLLSNQSMILSFLKEKLEIVNFIVWGYKSNLPILINNRFLHSVSHVYYRSLIVEICTLFDNHKHQSNNFYLLINANKKYLKELRSDAVSSIEQKLKESLLYFTDEIKDARNEEISHFRFKEGTKISLNHKYLTELNCLYNIAFEIIRIASNGVIDQTNSAQYEIGLSGDDLRSLQNLLNELSGFDYYSKWKMENKSLTSSCR